MSWLGLNRAVQAGSGQRPPDGPRVSRDRLQDRKDRLPVLEQFSDGARTGRLRAGRHIEDAVVRDKGGDRPAVAKVGLGKGP